MLPVPQMVQQAGLAVGCLAVGWECARHRHEAAACLLSALRQHLSVTAAVDTTGAAGVLLTRLGRVCFSLGDALEMPNELVRLLTHVFLFDVVRLSLC